MLLSFLVLLFSLGVSVYICEQKRMRRTDVVRRSDGLSNVYST